MNTSTALLRIPAGMAVNAGTSLTSALLPTRGGINGSFRQQHNARFQKGW